MVKYIRVIIGANYGDEGKGLITDYFASQSIKNGMSTCVVLTNGGAQRGHTVVTPDGIKHVFHHFGSGYFAGADTFLPKQFIVNPMIFCKEIMDGLYKSDTKIIVDPDCIVSTPFDMLANMIKEETRGENRHGSVGVGIWETILRKDSDEENKTLTFNEMIEMNDQELEVYLKNVREYYAGYIIEYGCSLDKYSKIFFNENLIKNYIQDFKIMCKICNMRNASALADYESLIFENGQGLLLDTSLNDPDNGYYTTPSNTGFKNVDVILDPKYVKLNRNTYKEVVFVTRSYLTKHGGKDIPNKTELDFVKKEYETNVPNDYQGSLMYAEQDWDDFTQRFREEFIPVFDNWIKTIAVTHCDENDDIPIFAAYKSYGPTRNDVKTFI